MTFACRREEDRECLAKNVEEAPLSLGAAFQRQ